MKIKCFSIYLCTVLVAGLLSGCAGGDSNDAARNVSEAASGSAVSGEAVSGEKSDTYYQDCYATDTNFYDADYDMDETGTQPYLIQTRLDGSHKQKIPVENAYDVSLLSVEQDKIYYLTVDRWEKDESPSSIWCAPIEKNSEGYDVVKTEKAEVLYTDPVDMRYVYMDSQSILYLREYEEVVMVDRKTGKPRIQQGIVFDEDYEVGFGRCGDYYLAVVGEEKLYVKKHDKDEWMFVEKITDSSAHSGAAMWVDEIVYGTDAAYYLPYTESGDFRIVQFRPALGEQREILSEEMQIRDTIKTVPELSDVPKDSLWWCMSDWFCRNGRLYLQLEIDYKKDDIYHMAYYLFSIEEVWDDNDYRLRYEQEMTEWMQGTVPACQGRWMNNLYTNHVLVEEEVLFENSVVRNAKCYYMMDGKAFIVARDEKKEKDAVYCYDMATGKAQKLTKKEKLFYEPTKSIPAFAGTDQEDLIYPSNYINGAGPLYHQDKDMDKGRHREFIPEKQD